MENNVDVEKFVNAVADGKNIEANKYLEKVLQQKCAEKIKNTLNS